MEWDWKELNNKEERFMQLISPWEGVYFKKLLSEVNFILGLKTGVARDGDRSFIMNQYNMILRMKLGNKELDYAFT